MLMLFEEKYLDKNMKKTNKIVKICESNFSVFQIELVHWLQSYYVNENKS